MTGAAGAGEAGAGAGAEEPAPAAALSTVLRVGARSVTTIRRTITRCTITRRGSAVAADFGGPSAGSPPARTCTARKASRAKKAASDPASRPNGDGVRRSVLVAAMAPAAVATVAAVVLDLAAVAAVMVLDLAAVVLDLDGAVVLGVVAPAAAVAGGVAP